MLKYSDIYNSTSPLVSLVFVQLEDSLLTCTSQQFSIFLFEDVFGEGLPWIIQNILFLHLVYESLDIHVDC